MPGANTVGVSQRIEDEQERQRLRNLVTELALDGEAAADVAIGGDTVLRMHPEPADGYIVRTAAEGVGEQMMQADAAASFEAYEDEDEADDDDEYEEV